MAPAAGDPLRHGHHAAPWPGRSEDQGISAPAQAGGGRRRGHNPISILIPCHRVVGSDGSLTGYAGGVVNKQFLLELEGVDMTGLYVPTRGTAL